MQKLTRRQEIELLRDLTNPSKYTVLSSGSSRIVFRSLRDSFRVIKLAVGDGGLRQNDHEVAIAAYDSDIFAKIYRYGQFVLEMEYVIPVAEQTGWLQNDKFFLKHGIYNVGFTPYDKYQLLCDSIEGYTNIEGSENWQLGLNRRNELVCYDYGYVDSDNCNSQIGSADSIDTNKKLRIYVNLVNKCLREKRNPYSLNLEREFPCL